MKRRQHTSSRSDIREGEKGPANQLSGEVKLGDLIWVRLHESSWWPAQVVDANTVSESIKPSNRSVGEVLVRLYGSYEYLFVDHMESRCEFEHVLEQNNGSYHEIFHKSLERDRPHFISSGSKGKGSKSKEFKVEACTSRKLKQNLFEDYPTLVASESSIDMLEGYPDIAGRLTRAQKGSLVAESLEDDVSDDEGIMQRSVKYLVNVGTSYQARVSQKILPAGNPSPTMDRDGFVLLDGPEEPVTIKTSKKDGVKNKLSSFTQCFEEEMKSKTGFKQKKVQKKLMPNSPSAKEARSNRTPEKYDLPKKLKHSPMTPTYEAVNHLHQVILEN